jgi:tRNA threonylcarbamoyladenosine biosynthesis protein TsaB
VPVLAVDTLLALAEEARVAAGISGDVGITALLDARMDEIYANNYIFSSGIWLTDGDCRLIKPEHLGDFVAAAQGTVNLLAGNVFEPYGARLAASAVPHIVALPTAAALLRLAPRLMAAGAAVPAAQALPTYVRNKVAQTTQERAAHKAEVSREFG